MQTTAGWIEELGYTIFTAIPTQHLFVQKGMMHWVRPQRLDLSSLALLIESGQSY